MGGGTLGGKPSRGPPGQRAQIFELCFLSPTPNFMFSILWGSSREITAASLAFVKGRGSQKYLSGVRWAILCELLAARVSQYPKIRSEVGSSSFELRTLTSKVPCSSSLTTSHHVFAIRFCFCLLQFVFFLFSVTSRAKFELQTSHFGSPASTSNFQLRTLNFQLYIFYLELSTFDIHVSNFQLSTFLLSTFNFQLPISRWKFQLKVGNANPVFPFSTPHTLFHIPFHTTPLEHHHPGWGNTTPKNTATPLNTHTCHEYCHPP